MEIPSEDFLHFLWKTKGFDVKTLNTTSGDEIQILDLGVHNHDAGPDFSNAKLRIGNHIWVGNVEIHIKASDWNKHKHSQNSSYDSVILHVVYEEDIQIQNSQGNNIPCFEFKNRIPKNVLSTYHKLQAGKNENLIPCQSLLHTVSDLRKNIFLERLLVERLEYKSKFAMEIYEEEKGDWYMIFIRMLLVAFGTKVNKEACIMLGQRLDKRIILQLRSKLNSLEAYLFGLSGFLEDGQDVYSLSLAKEYIFLKQKYQLQSLPKNIWKFSRMRPQNFPTIRIAQLCALLNQKQDILNQVLELDVNLDLKNIFNVELSSYWNNHFTLGQESTISKKNMGKTFQDLICINCFSPFLFLYGQQHDDQRYKDRAIMVLEDLKAEKNKITKQWESLGMENKTAKNSQALIHLKNNYCSNMQCLSCDIGYTLLKTQN